MLQNDSILCQGQLKKLLCYNFSTRKENALRTHAAATAWQISRHLRPMLKTKKGEMRMAIDFFAPLHALCSTPRWNLSCLCFYAINNYFSQLKFYDNNSKSNRNEQVHVLIKITVQTKVHHRVALDSWGEASCFSTTKTLIRIQGIDLLFFLLFPL